MVEGSTSQQERIDWNEGTVVAMDYQLDTGAMCNVITL